MSWTADKVAYRNVDTFVRAYQGSELLWEKYILSIPEDEIWYTSKDKTTISISSQSSPFEGNLISNTYSSSLNVGIMKFDTRLTYIPEYAFLNKTKLIGFALPNSITELKLNCFYGTDIGYYSTSSYIREVFGTNCYLPESITTIGDYVFSNCQYFTGFLFILPYNLSTIGSSLSKSTKLVFPPLLTQVENHSCTYLEYMIMTGNTPPTVGSDSFGSNTSDVHFTNSTLSSTYRAAWGSDFSHWSFLSDAYKYSYTTNDGCPITFTNSNIGSSATYVGQLFRRSLSSGEIYTIGKMYMGEGLFKNKSNLTSFDFDIGIWNYYAYIDKEAFYGTGLINVNINLENCIFNINEGAFNHCTNLTSVNISNTNTININRYSFANCTSLRTFNSNIISYLEEYAFYNDTNLTSFTIQDTSIATIGNNVFEGCTNLEEFIINNTTPPTLGTDVFLNTSSSLLIKVPAGSVTAYQTATNWSQYASKIVSQ